MKAPKAPKSPVTKTVSFEIKTLLSNVAIKDVLRNVLERDQVLDQKLKNLYVNAI